MLNPSTVQCGPISLLVRCSLAFFESLGSYAHTHTLRIKKLVSKKRIHNVEIVNKFFQISEFEDFKTH